MARFVDDRLLVFRVHTPYTYRCGRFVLRAARYAFQGILVLLAPMAALGQSTGAWIDATQNTYTGSAGGDMCMAINKAYQNAPFNATIDARGFTGVQACNTSMLSGSAVKEVTLLLPINAIVVASVSQWTPYVPHLIDGGNEGQKVGTASTAGLTWALCGPNSGSLDGVTMSGTSCVVHPSWFGGAMVTVPPFVGTIFFTVPHGKFPASTAGVPATYYGGAFNVGGAGTGGTAGSINGTGWINYGLGHNIRNIRCDFGGNSNVFCLYTQQSGKFGL